MFIYYEGRCYILKAFLKMGGSGRLGRKGRERGRGVVIKDVLGEERGFPGIGKVVGEVVGVGGCGLGWWGRGGGVGHGWRW